MTEAPKHVVEETKVVQSAPSEAEQAQTEQVHTSLKIDRALRETAAAQENAALKVTRALEDQQAERRKRFGKAVAVGLGATAVGAGLITAGIVVAPAGTYVGIASVAALIKSGEIAAGAMLASGEVLAALGISSTLAGSIGRSANRRTRVPRMA